MGMHTRQIRDKCIKCKEYHELRLVPGSDFNVDWCKLADRECATIKTCNRPSKAWVKYEDI
jgi:hypothetical protein